MFNPVATYRIQFNKDFTFENLDTLIPYYKQLGVSTIYASPIFAAVPGSTHGYDVTNPHIINPEIGTLEQLRNITGKLKQEGISWVQDMVPNHMAFHPDNKWLMDVLEKGTLSKYASFFDMAGTSELFEGRIMVPFLGAELDTVINKNELKVVYQNGGFALSNYDSAYPLKMSSYADVLGFKKLDNQAIAQLSAQVENLLLSTEPAAFAKASNEFKLQLTSLYKKAATKKIIDETLSSLNADKQRLKLLVNDQHYRLCSWQETDGKINFRRFFTVNGLICLNMQDKEVFNHYHQFINSLVQEGIFQGLRVDHIDGLYDPAGYLKSLRELVGDKTYIVAEKILEEGEKLPETWPIQGTTGYDYLAQVNNLFTNQSAEKKFDKLYQKITDDQQPVHKQISAKKAYILQQHMGGELDNLASYFYKLNLVSKQQIKTVNRENLKKAIAAFLVYCPVYRFYGNAFPLTGEETKEVNNILNDIKKNHNDLTAEIEVLRTVFTGPAAKDDTSRLKFYQRCMQFTGPLMAKGVEDTLMYTYNRFAGHNEVGDAPDAFGISAERFHDLMQKRQQQWPLAMNGTSTHDTKRGEDVRARLNVLTDMAGEWKSLVKHWRKVNNPFKTGNAPDANDEYLIYQTIAGSYPMPGEDAGDYETRLHQYLEKALREAKTHTQWAEPNEEYEQAAKQFASALLDKQSAFWQSFEPFYSKIVDFGIVNSLAQVALKFTNPGVPDVYQGCERWDLSLVDPDNRRPVDYALHQQMLRELQTVPENLWHERFNGKIKLWFVQKLVDIRKQHAELFAKGDYLPLKVRGKYKDNVLAFVRHYKSAWVVTIIPLNLALLTENINEIDWRNTRVELPDTLPNQYQNILTSAKAKTKGDLKIAEVLKDFPVSVLKFEFPPNDRGSGILMHITSLPSAFGIGDMGPQAYQFADFLASCRQKYWQILPLSPTEMAGGNSPYSSFSSVAGNTLLISPELLSDKGWLNNEQLTKAALPATDKVNYEKAAAIRTQIFEAAWQSFKQEEATTPSNEFKEYCRNEAEWLDDFALYAALKYQHGGKPWYLWHNNYKFREEASLKAFAVKHADDILKEKWLQFIFKQQWGKLKAYCNDKNIQIIGDMPFYISYDSVDVWANRELFDLSEKGEIQGVAGVPPDYFNADGQLWGMPVFKWDKLKETGYAWWLQRIRKNLELFDVIRLDHFRAFSAYFHVPAGEQTAINGSWKPGPGEDFFMALQQEFGSLPFIAEDLGEIDEPVHQLRDKFNLPGMRILQFAFGDDTGASPYTPHNYSVNSIAYPGTHDNNTTVGWYLNDADENAIKQIQQYTGTAVNKYNVHTVMHRLLLSSVAKTVIIPMQDVLGLDGQARINVPASVNNNWLWRLTAAPNLKKIGKRLREQTELYNRI